MMRKSPGLGRDALIPLQQLPAQRFVYGMLAREPDMDRVDSHLERTSDAGPKHRDDSNEPQENCDRITGPQ